MKLYVKDVIREPNDTLYTFLRKVFKLNGSFFGKYTVNSTYLDSEFKKVQCGPGKHRSFDDIVLISKTYFKVSNKIIAKTILKILNDDNNLLLVLCDSAKKWVLNYGLTESKIFKYCAKYDKSDYKTDDCGVGDYSFDDIITLMGLTKEDVKINN